jgi:hypothetical protein
MSLFPSLYRVIGNEQIKEPAMKILLLLQISIFTACGEMPKPGTNRETKSGRTEKSSGKELKSEYKAGEIIRNAILGIAMTVPQKFSAKLDNDELKIEFRSTDPNFSGKIIASYGFGMNTATVRTDLQKPIPINDKVSFQPLEAIKSEGNVISQKYGARGSSGVVIMHVAAYIRDTTEGPGGFAFYGVAIEKDEGKVSESLDALLASIQSQTMEENNQAKEALAKGKWLGGQSEDINSSQNGSGYGNQSEYIKFCSNEFRYYSYSYTSISIPNGGGASSEKKTDISGRFYVFGEGADLFIVGIDRKTGETVTLDAKLAGDQLQSSIGNFKLSGEGC